MIRPKCILVLMFLFLNACATNQSGVNVGRIPSDIPNRDDLKQKIAQACENQMRNEWYAWFRLTRYSLEENIRPEDAKNPFEGKNITIVSCSTHNFIKKPISEYERDISALVAVEMDVFVKRGSDEPKKIKDWTDYWVLIGNSWYWTFRGFPAD